MIVRIAGIILPQDKRIAISLRYIYGIGTTRANDILRVTKVDPDTRTKNLAEAEVNALRMAVESGGYHIEGDLRRDTASNIRRLKDIASYRGSRHTRGLPVRGQRTKTNSRSVRGNVRKTMGSGKKPPTKKQ